MFPNVVNVNQAPGVEGDFASTNPFSSVLAGAGQLVAPLGGVAVGRFAFVNPANNAVSQNFSAGFQIGFVGRDEQALITNFLGEATLVIPQGFMVVLFSGGDFWARFAGGAVSGAQVFADETTGRAVSGSATDTATAAAGFTGTASLATVSGVGQLTIATITAGTVITIGDVVTGTGVVAGTTITGLVSGVANTVGAVYSLSTPPTTEAAEAITTSSTTLNVTAVLTGGLAVGDVLTGTGVTAGTTITSVPPAGGGVGAYGLSVAQNFAPTTVTVVGGNIATQFTVRSNCGPGELAKISAPAT